MHFPKTAKTFSEQITLLKKRGLLIEDDAAAGFHLNNISYYRLSAYFFSFQKYGDPDHTFMPWATFNRIMDVYVFDRELRSIVLDAIERIEVAVRCRIVYEYCHTYGNNWYENPALFLRKHSRFIALVNKELSVSKEEFITHYFGKYTAPKNPPAWMVMEILSFGTISTMFKNMKNDTAKKSVASYFGVSPAIMDSWLEHLVYIRNVCAHHCRLWNRTMTVKATLPSMPSYRWIEKQPSKQNKIYTTLCILVYLLQRVTKNSPFKGKLQVLLTRFDRIDQHAAGFPNDWNKDLFWNNIRVAWTHKARVIAFTVKNRFKKVEDNKLK